MSDGYLMHSGEILRWQSAFQSQLCSPKYRKAALLLQLQAETTRVGLHGSLNRTECDWDHFILDFQLMVAHAKQVFGRRVPPTLAWIRIRRRLIKTLVDDCLLLSGTGDTAGCYCSDEKGGSQGIILGYFSSCERL